jgi:hypothetical protein
MEDWIKDLREFVCEPPDPSEFMEVPICATKGTYWITNGIETRMIIGDIPEGWWKGRGKVLSDEGRKRCLKHLKENNPNAKKYKIVYRDGSEEIVNQLSTWARNNGHKYNTIKAIVHRSKYKKEKQFECYNSPTYYIKEIVPL